MSVGPTFMKDLECFFVIWRRGENIENMGQDQILRAKATVGAFVIHNENRIVHSFVHMVWTPTEWHWCAHAER